MGEGDVCGEVVRGFIDGLTPRVDWGWFGSDAGLFIGAPWESIEPNRRLFARPEAPAGPPFGIKLGLIVTEVFLSCKDGFGAVVPLTMVKPPATWGAGCCMCFPFRETEGDFPC